MHIKFQTKLLIIHIIPIESEKKREILCWTVFCPPISMSLVKFKTVKMNVNANWNKTGKLSENNILKAYRNNPLFFF